MYAQSYHDLAYILISFVSRNPLTFSSFKEAAFLTWFIVGGFSVYHALKLDENEWATLVENIIATTGMVLSYIREGHYLTA